MIRAGERDGACGDPRRRGRQCHAERGSTPLHWAVYKVDAAAGSRLLQKGAQPDARSSAGRNTADGSGQARQCRAGEPVAQGKGRPRQRQRHASPSLMLAAQTGSLEVSQLLIKAGSEVNAKEGWRGQTALMWAVAGRNAGLADLLIRRGADVEARAEANDWGSQVTSEPRAQYRPTGGLTVLLYAIRGGCLDCVKSVLKRGASIDRPTPDGITPLMSAIDTLQFWIANYPARPGANPHHADWWGPDALYIAVAALVQRSLSAGGGQQCRGGSCTPNNPAALAISRRLPRGWRGPEDPAEFHVRVAAATVGVLTDDC